MFGIVLRRSFDTYKFLLAILNDVHEPRIDNNYWQKIVNSF